jgi:hypothetical protein
MQILNLVKLADEGNKLAKIFSRGLEAFLTY